MNLNLKISHRFLAHDKIQTLFIVLGIAIGVSVQMFVGLLIDSLQANLIQRTVGKSSHITISNSDDKELLNNSSLIISRLENNQNIKKIQTKISTGAVAEGNNETEGVVFQGFELFNNDIYGISENLTAGKLPKTSNEILIGTDLSEKLKVFKGDSLRITENSGKSGVFRISGIFDSGVKAINETWVVSEVSNVQKFIGAGNKVDQIVIQIDKVFEADTISSNIKNEITIKNIKISNWKDENKELLSALSSQSGSSFMIQFFVLVSVAIAISSVLSITVVQKQRQIGILKAMGLKNKDSLIIFMFSSFILGLIGSLLGTLLGFLLFYSFIKGTGTFEPIIRWFFVIITAVISTLAATLAGVAPARRSAKLDPIEIIQNE